LRRPTEDPDHTTLNLAALHHIVFWRHHGETKIDNLVLLCTKHHRLIHRSEWKVQIAQDGLPEFTPPAYLDPTGEPRRNTVHLRVRI
uniref:HNH endonuclease signature motif containing protein n=1 Tax=Amycolatopsis orientalis TaxID=31958 RepID=UPI001377E8EA